MNLPARPRSSTTSFAAARKSPGSGWSRASERKMNFAIAMSAAASIPWPDDVSEHDRQPPVGQLEEVVDVAADLDARRGS